MPEQTKKKDAIERLVGRAENLVAGLPDAQAAAFIDAWEQESAEPQEFPVGDSNSENSQRTTAAFEKAMTVPVRTWIAWRKRARWGLWILGGGTLLVLLVAGMAFYHLSELVEWAKMLEAEDDPVLWVSTAASAVITLAIVFFAYQLLSTAQELLHPLWTDRDLTEKKTPDPPIIALREATRLVQTVLREAKGIVIR